MKDMHNRKNIS